MKMKFEQSNFLGKEQRWREADKYLAWIRITKTQYQCYFNVVGLSQSCQNCCRVLGGGIECHIGGGCCQGKGGGVGRSGQ